MEDLTREFFMDAMWFFKEKKGEAGSWVVKIKNKTGTPLKAHIDHFCDGVSVPMRCVDISTGKCTYCNNMAPKEVIAYHGIYK